ncbi:hypothetical protein OP10G_0283 [Fimbriimonas ginsengisoli Gsoil 348]|uniref:Uncharacterized protein n=1 Tax=Fimbriimonas ginsengisoli Gsoil 348 TaxID=661478 RepID=A0A068NJH6_FIMGI|nr:hypothetical protein OP10G_0283 [Fimbriimonas ginsengisoli Gsoil 348]
MEDIQGVTPAAASKALSRLAEQGKLKRVAKGVYHSLKKTPLGASKPSAAAMVRRTLKDKTRPTGASAANLLGLSTQVPARPQLVVFGSNLPADAYGARVHLRRGARSHPLTELEGALLEFLRDRGAYAQTGGEETLKRLGRLLKSELSESRLRELRDAAQDEPPRVRAVLGALFEHTGLSKSLFEPLRKSLNPLSKFDFGLLRELPNALEWQAK